MSNEVHNTPLQAIRLNCLECGDGTPKQVRGCHIDDCPLYPFRFGRNPQRKGIGQKTNLESNEGIS